MTIGDRIKKIRQEKGLSQKELGEMLGVSQQMIGQWETGKANPKIETVDKIAIALKVSRNDLLDWKDIPEVVDYVYSSVLTDLIDMLPNKRYNLSDNEQKRFISKMNAYVEEGNKIKDLDKREDYFSDAIVKISHELLDHLLEPYLEYDVMDLVDLVAYYLSFNSNIQSLIDELLINLDDNSHVHKRDDE